MSLPKYHSLFVEITSALLLLLFVYVGTSKHLDRSSFESVIGRSPLIGWASAGLSYAIPTLEIFIAFLLMPRITRRLGLLLSWTLLLLFTLYITYMVLFEVNLPCSCGGILNRIGWKEHILINVALLILAFTAWRLESLNNRFIAINRQSRKPV